MDSNVKMKLWVKVAILLITLNFLDYFLTLKCVSKGYGEVSLFFKTSTTYFAITCFLIVVFVYSLNFVAEKWYSKRNITIRNIGYTVWIVEKTLPVIHNFLLLFFDFETPLAKIYIEILKHLKMV